MDSPNTFKSSDLAFVRIWAASIGVLLAQSWKLWFPGFTEFPGAPVFDALGDPVLVAIQYVAALLLIAGLIGVFVSGKLQQSSTVVAAAFAILFVCNQQCLQPWAWQGFIIAVLLATLPMREAKVWIARVLISIYLFSAIGKFDYQFIHSLGQNFLGVVLNWFGAADLVSDQLKSKLVLLFPIGELLIAIGLLLPQTRKAAAWMAIVLHVVLIAILSPVGLNHRWPVVVWNAMSILFVVWLFLRPVEASRAESRTANTLSYVGILFAMVVLVGPLLRPMQLWDHWLAWGLYSPSNSRIEVYISDAARARCGPEAEEYFAESTDQFGSIQIEIDRWSLGELGVPIYPQARVQKSATIRWLRDHDILDQAKLIEYGPSHPVSGKRKETRIELPNVLD